MSPSNSNSPLTIFTLCLSCDVSDGLVKLGKLQGGFLPGLTMWSPQRQEGNTKIVGPAYTVKYVAADDEAAKHPTHYVGCPMIAVSTHN